MSVIACQSLPVSSHRLHDVNVAPLQVRDNQRVLHHVRSSKHPGALSVARARSTVIKITQQEVPACRLGPAGLQITGNMQSMSLEVLS